MPPLLPFDRERFVRFFFFAAFAWVAYQLFVLSRPFLPGLLAAVMLAMAFSPLRDWVHKKMRSRTLAALVMSAGALVMVVLPLIAICQVIIQEAGKLLPTVQELLEDVQKHDLVAFKERIPVPLQAVFYSASTFLRTVNIGLKSMVLDNATKIGALISSGGLFLARHALFALFNAIVMMIVLFFMFRDGDRYAKWFLNAIPMRLEHKQALVARVYETFRAITIGVFATAAAQGLTATIGFWIAGVRLPLMLGIGTGLASLIGASFLVTVPVGLTMLANNVPWGLFLLAWGMGLVGLMDNFLKPILIGSRARMPFVLIFFSILGGLKLYGLMGLFLGPILVATFLTFLKIYQEEYPA